MPSQCSPSSSVQAARQALAARLREIRIAAGLTGRALSEAAGWNPAKTSRIEKAVQPATAADIRTWCEVTGAHDQIGDLIASLLAAEGAYVEWRRLERGGLSRLQRTYAGLYEQTRRFRSYQSNVIPGLLQTEDYARAMLGAFATIRQIGDDSAEAARIRLQRQRLLHSHRRFAFVLEEGVLHGGPAGPDAMAAQLRHLLEVSQMRSVSLGVIPVATLTRPVWTLEGFLLFDDSRAHIELLTARAAITAPSELRTYERAFTELAGLAVHGEAARDLITAALQAL